ncbi:MAG: hypothetical protein RLZZ09_2844 [Pseudomonadota bacterium]
MNRRTLLRDGLAALLPWLAFARDPLAGTVPAAAVALLVWLFLRAPAWRELKRSEGMILLFFLGAWVFPGQSLTRRPEIMIPLLLAMASFASVIAGRPCTLDYSRSMVGPEWWSNRHFLRVNSRLTLVWGVCFVLSAALAWLGGGLDGIPKLAAKLAQPVLYISALCFTRGYPSWYRLHRYLPLVRAGHEHYIKAPR